MSARHLLEFRRGTLELDADESANAWVHPSFHWDPRAARWRAPAYRYGAIGDWLTSAGRVQDAVGVDRSALIPSAETGPTMRPFQREAIVAWQNGKHRGQVILPTGAGKSELAVQALAARGRSALVLVPTLDLLSQWVGLLRRRFATPVGIVGGGDYRPTALTVMTYDSAYLHLEHLGERFDLAVFDECHHLPSDAYAFAARCLVAPARLGLSATPERMDGRHEALDDLIGPEVYRREVTHLEGDYLAPYRVEPIAIELDDDEAARYREARACYRNFLQAQGLRIRGPQDWSLFVKRAASSSAGREALDAYQEQRRLAFAARAKLRCVSALLFRHRHERALVFTQDNRTAYTIAYRCLIPVITHQTRPTERSAILAALREGTYNAVVTSKVLNEGVDVPSASVAIVVSGSGSVREHVQRLGRVLRKHGDKQALLYELVTQATGEEYTSARRREHIAYERSAQPNTTLP